MSEKTEKASPKKERQARQDGDIAKSAEFTGAMVLIGAATATLVTISTIGAELVGLMGRAITTATSGQELGRAVIELSMNDALMTMGRCIAPVLAVAFVAAGFFTYLQTGAIFTLKPLMPKGDKLNPVNGLKNMFSKDKAVDLIKNIAKLSIMGAIAYSLMMDELPALIQTPKGDLTGAMAAFGASIKGLAMSLIGTLLVFGAADLFLQRQRHAKKLMMSKDDVKREYKESEGDGQIKGQRKQLHQEMLNDPGVKRVPDADAIVVNPTHIAVAIRYRDNEMDAPTIIAQGRGELAQQIKKLARQHHIPIVRNVPLARALIELDVDDQIPPDFYDAVAEILNFVYSLRQGR